MQTKLLGSSNQGSIAPAEMAVDPLFLAARMAIRPLDYTGAGRVLGYYRAASVNTALTPAANAILHTLRWTDVGSYFVLLRQRWSFSVATAVTAQRLDAMPLTIARAYTASETTNFSAVTLTGNTGKMRTAPMGSSLVAQFAIASAAAGISGGTRTLDKYGSRVYSRVWVDHVRFGCGACRGL